LVTVTATTARLIAATTPSSPSTSTAPSSASTRLALCRSRPSDIGVGIEIETVIAFLDRAWRERGGRFRLRTTGLNSIVTLFFALGCRISAYGRILYTIIFDREPFVFLTANQSLLLCNLLGEVDGNVTVTLQLARKTTAIDEVPRADERKLLRPRLENIVFTVDHATATLSTTWHTFTN
jgi:hypothetical protein